MKLKQKNTILENEVAVDITVAALGDSQLDEAEELELLHNFPKYVEYSDITFEGNMKLDGKVPVVTDEEADDTAVVAVKLPTIMNQKHVIDEDLHITFSVNAAQIPESSLNEVLKSKDIMAQAYVTLFVDKVKAAIAEKLEELKAQNNTFEGETEYIL